MKIIRNKGALQKIIITLVFLILFNFMFPVYSRAFGGGTLIEPIKDLVLGIGDAVINFLQDKLLPGSPKAVDKRSVESMMADYVKNNYKGTSKVEDVLNKLEVAAWKVDSFLSEIPGLKQFSEWLAPDQYKERVISLIVYSPAAIFSNMVPALDVNFINPNVWYKGGEGTFELVKEGDSFNIKYNYKVEKAPSTDKEKYEDNTAYQLRDTIAKWYVALRNIAVVGLLSVLVYVSIRIIISSTAGETAKYKSMLKDWIIAMCILFFMHYMMAFLLKSTEMITSLFKTDNVLSNVNTQTEVSVKGDKFMNEARQTAEEFEDEDGDKDILTEFAYTIIYIVLIFYTIIFTWKYLKRFVYLAFLTMIAPMVAMTYPIDKIKDGSAQAFNMWFKEYVFNVLIQPIHLLLYTILISSAQSFAEKNLIYTIVAIGFMLEAEKIVKSMFGFNKAEGGVMSSAITGGALFGTVAGLVKSGASKLPGGSSKSPKGSNSSNEGKVRFADRNADSDATSKLGGFISGATEGTGGSQRGNPTDTPTTGNPVGGQMGALPNRNGAGNATGNATGSSGKYNSALFNKASSLYGGAKNKIANTPPIKMAGTAAGAVKEKVGKAANKVTGSALGRRTKAVVGEAKNIGKDLSKTRPAKVIRGAKSVAGKFINKDNAKKAIKLAATGLGAATLGTVGLAAGLASDKPQDILNYAGLGAGAGALAGSSIADAIPTVAGGITGGVSDTIDTFQQGYYGDEYEEKVLNPKLDREWKNDKEVQKHFRQTYGDNYKEKMKQALDLRKAGITDQGEIDTAIKLIDKNEGLTVDQAANIMQFTKDLTKSDVMKNRDKVKESAKNMVGDEATAEKITQLTEQRFKLR